MKNLIKNFLIITVLCFASGITAIAQNCGIVTGFSTEIVDNQDGTCTYTFTVDYDVTSGGEKSVNTLIACGSTVFVDNVCNAFTGPTTQIYGPYTVPCCTEGIVLTWTGHTNSNCGGTSCADDIVVPVEMAGFKGSSKANRIFLSWVTTNEINNDHFLIEHSIDGENFELLAKVDGALNSTEEINYGFSHENPSHHSNYYRLRQVDTNGDFRISDVIYVEHLNIDHKTMVYPNPSKGITQVISELNGKLSVFDINGRIYKSYTKDKRNLEIDLSDMPQGYYMISIQNDIDKEVIPLILNN